MTFSIAEDIQLMLTEQPGRLEYQRLLPAAGTLIELALLGRLTSTKKPGFFATPLDCLLTVVDGPPTGQPILDVALEVLSVRKKPWRCDRALLAIYRDVGSATNESLEGRGFARPIGKPSDHQGHLEITDAASVDARRAVLRRARTLPDTVTDARLGAVVDVLRNSGNRFRGETGLQEISTRDWYPAHVTPTALGILKAEHYLCGSQ